MPSPTLDSPTESLRRLVDDTLSVWEPVWQSWAAAASSWPATLPVAPRNLPESRHVHHPGHERGHGHSHESPYGCDACSFKVCDADLVVVTRLGESRIVPLTIHNDIRREQTVKVSVGDFSAPCRNDVDIRLDAAVRPGGEIALAPCSRTEVTILLRSAALARADSEVGPGLVVKPIKEQESVAPATRTRKTAAVAASPIEAAKGVLDAKGVMEAQPLEGVEDKDLPDVKCATTLYTDVSVGGCGRSLRLAVVVLPRTCDSYDVRCSCGCC